MPTPGQTIKPLVKLGKTPDACWTWLGSTTPNGWPKKTVNGEETSAKKWLWQSLFGSLTDDLVLASVCGNLLCINPHHLRACTQADANRSGIGAKLTAGDVTEIKREKATRTHGTAERLAGRYGVTQGTIHSIWGGRSWGKAGLRRKTV